jgi:hypothetical protein
VNQANIGNQTAGFSNQTHFGNPPLGTVYALDEYSQNNPPIGTKVHSAVSPVFEGSLSKGIWNGLEVDQVPYPTALGG